MSFTVYVFRFSDNGDVARIPYAKWNRILSGDESIERFANQAVFIAYAYISLENSKPDYCYQITGGVYYFGETGHVTFEVPYIDLLQDMYEHGQCVIDFQYHKKKKEYSKKYQWHLSSLQIQSVLDLIW